MSKQEIVEEFFSRYFSEIKNRNYLLGTFSADGDYKIDDQQTIEALKVLPKTLIEATADMVYAQTQIGGIKFQFKVKTTFSDSECKEELFVVEMEKNLSGDKFHQQSIDCFVGNRGLDIQEREKLMFERWNIIRTASEIDLNSYILKILLKIEKYNMFMFELLDTLSQIYILKMLALLEKCGDKGKNIVKRYNKALEQFKQEKRVLNGVLLKQFLDEMIIEENLVEQVIQIDKGETIVEFGDAIKSATESKKYKDFVKEEKLPEAIEVKQEGKTENPKQKNSQGTQKNETSKEEAEPVDSKFGLNSTTSESIDKIPKVEPKVETKTEDVKTHNGDIKNTEYKILGAYDKSTTATNFSMTSFFATGDSYSVSSTLYSSPLFMPGEAQTLHDYKVEGPLREPEIGDSAIHSDIFKVGGSEITK